MYYTVLKTYSAFGQTKMEQNSETTNTQIKELLNKGHSKKKSKLQRKMKIYQSKRKTSLSEQSGFE
jgi:hypothetical protein